MKVRSWFIVLTLGLCGCGKGQKPDPPVDAKASPVVEKQMPQPAPAEQPKSGTDIPSGTATTDQTKNELPAANAGDPATRHLLLLAFGPGVERIPSTSVKPIPPPDSQVGPCPSSVQAVIEWSNRRAEIASSSSPPPDALTAISFLGLRAARRAIAENPNHPDSYYALYLALTNPELPIADSERTIGQVTALQQCLMRLPSPKQFQVKTYRAPPYWVAQRLAMFYFGDFFLTGRTGPGISPGLPIMDMPALGILLETRYKEGVIGLLEQNGRIVVARLPDAIRVGRTIDKHSIRALDLAREMMVLAVQYGEKEFAADSTDLKSLKEMLKTIEDQLSQANKSFEIDRVGAATKMKHADQVQLALRHHLAGKALELLSDKEIDLQKEFGRDYLEAILVRIALELATGSLEDVAEDLAEARTQLERASLEPTARRFLSNQVQSMTYQKLIYEGNYQEAGKHLESKGIIQEQQDPPVSPALASFKHDPALMTFGVDRALECLSLIPDNPLGTISRDILLSSSNFWPVLQRQQLLTAIRREHSASLSRRGLVSLIDGDIPDARKWFLQSRRPGVPEWGVPPQRDENAERYLKLIETAAGVGRN